MRSLPPSRFTYNDGTTWTDPTNSSRVYSVPDQLVPTNLDASEQSIDLSIHTTYNQWITQEESSFNVGAGVTIGEGTKAFTGNFNFSRESYHYHELMKTTDVSWRSVGMYMCAVLTTCFFLFAPGRFWQLGYLLQPVFAGVSAARLYAEGARVAGGDRPAAAFHQDRRRPDQVQPGHSVLWHPLCELGQLWRQRTSQHVCQQDRHVQALAVLGGEPVWPHTPLRKAGDFFRWFLAALLTHICVYASQQQYLFQLSGGGFFNHSSIHRSSAFVEASKTFTYFRGGNVLLQSNMTARDWVDSIPLNPVYLNCTIQDLSILVSNTAVATQLRKVIQTYIDTGKLPPVSDDYDYEAFYDNMELRLAAGAKTTISAPALRGASA